MDDAVFRCWFPVHGIDPDRVRPEHLHAAVTRWMDGAPGSSAHRAQVKPYALSPLATREGQVGFEMGLLSRGSAELAWQGAARTGFRLGAQQGAVGSPVIISAETWSELERPTGQREWCLAFETPVTFRRGGRSSPLPTPASLLHGVSDTWDALSGLRSCRLRPEEVAEVWVSELDGRSIAIRLKVPAARHAGGRQAHAELSGFVGTITLRCDDHGVAAKVGSLLRLAPFSGLGSQKQKGLGVVRLLQEHASLERSA